MGCRSFSGLEGILVLGILSLALIATAGCGGGGGSGLPVASGGGAPLAMNGVVHGGQNPVAAAEVFAYQAGSSGYGRGDVKLACTTSNSVGEFSFGSTAPVCAGTGLPAAFSCPVTGSPNLYLLAVGGNPGGGANAALVMMAVLGNCNSVAANSFVTINEVTTSASTWALQQFMNCASGSVNGAASGCGVNSRDIGASATNATGLANALALVGNLVNLGTGLAQNSVGGTTAPTQEINTLADILQDCVNSTGAASTACNNLFTCAVPGAKPGTGNSAPCTLPTGASVPADTLTAALDIARNPVNNAVALFNLTSKAPAFTPVLGAAPSAWIVALNYTNSGMKAPDGIAIDAAGDAWLVNIAASSVIKLSPTGNSLNGVTGYTGGGLNSPLTIAIDPAGNAWIVNNNFPTTSVTELSSIGAAINNFTGNGINDAVDDAIDGQGNAWIVNGAITGQAADAVEISPSGKFKSGASGYTGADLTTPNAIAIDAAGNAWITNEFPGSVLEIGPAGSFLSPHGGYTGGAIGEPRAISIDPAGHVWGSSFIDDSTISIIFQLSSSGVPLPPLAGIAGGGMDTVYAIAIDSAGNSWVANCGKGCFGTLPSSITEISSSGVIVSPTAGCPNGPNCGFISGGINGAQRIAIDAAGDVWASNTAGNSITEFAGAASPVLTPKSECLELNTGHAVCLP